VQFHDWRANAALGELGFPRLPASYSQAQAALASSAVVHLDFCSRYGLVDTADWNLKLAWLFRSLEPQRVESYLRRVIALDPAQGTAHFNLGKELVRQGRDTEAAEAFREAVRLTPSLARFLPPRVRGSEEFAGAGAQQG
jgi:cytochrome c-type biogenesis protein CcmH/NrfG